jgi:signal transduction histidine kinase
MFKGKIILAAAAMIAGFAHAETEAENAARQFVKKAGTHLRANGVQKACLDFADPNGGFIKGELYIFVQDAQNMKMICHGTNPRMNGKDMLEMKDAEGKPFVKDMLELAKGKGSGWVDYRWVNPVSRNIELKSSYLERVDGYVVGAGIYKGK